MAIVEDDLEKRILENKRVIVRVWASTANIRIRGENAGHVSIEVSGRYMSLWPRQSNEEHPTPAIESEGLGITRPISHEFVPSYQIERDKYEGRDPEFTVCFYTLDNDRIKEKFNSLKEGPNKLEGWCLFGGICANAESCVSMVWELLIAGNIHKLVSKVEQSTASSKESLFGNFFMKKAISQSRVEDSSRGSTYSLENAIQFGIKSPDGLIAILKKAKLNELQKNRLTKHIYFVDESYFTGNEKPQNAVVSISK